MSEAARGETDDAFSPGKLFAGRYEIVELLGRGGMGMVLRARDLSLGEPIALKVLSGGADLSGIDVLRFRQEVKLARRVTHPNVARVFDLGEHEGFFYLTMELIEGSTLRALLKRDRRVPFAIAVQIAREIAAALVAAQEAGVVHRDLKPTNIMIDRSGRAVLTDFGIARSLVDAPELTVGPIGTPRYMAPEQAFGEAVDHRTDIYALGLCLYEMLTGRHAEGPREVLAEMLAQSGVPKALCALTVRCLEQAPEARPQSAAEVLRALTEIAAASSAPVPESRPRSAPDPREAAAAMDTTRPGPPQAVTPTKSATPRILAVLPFVYRGDKDTDYLADAITDELVDSLARNSSLRVLGTGSTAKYRHDRDPRAIARELSVFAVVDGTVQLAGARVRVNVRLIDAATSLQIWSDAHEGTRGDLFAFQAAAARQITEKLRSELTALSYRGGASSEAIEHYRSGRAKARVIAYESITAAVQDFERCTSLAPDFTPAIAGHAMACIRAWSFERVHLDAPYWERAATASIHRALEQAPDLAESHLAEAMRAVQCVEFAGAVRSLARALAIAPTCAEALGYLGEIECETGQSEAGLEHLELARELSPDLAHAVCFLARQHALEGRLEACDAVLAGLEQLGAASAAHARVTQVRVAAWRRDRAALQRFAASTPRNGVKFWDLVSLYARAVLGELRTEEIHERLGSAVDAVQNRRRQSALAQAIVEALAGHGDLEAAMRYLDRVADLPVIDLSWLDLCPLFTELRRLPGFAGARERIQARVDTLLQG